MSDLSIDEKIKEAQLNKLEAEIAKIKAETSKLWIDIGKIVFSALLGLFIGWFSQDTKVSLADTKAKMAEQEKKVTISETEKMIKDTNNSIEPLKIALTKTSAELQEKNSEKNSSVVVVTKPLIYIQFQGDITREFINELRGKLQAEFNAPGAQRIAGNYTSEVRYFSENKEDKERAERLANSVIEFFKSKNCSLNLPIKFSNLTAGKSSPPEVWLADEDFCD